MYEINKLRKRVEAFIDQTDETDLLLLNNYIAKAKIRGMATEDSIKLLEKDFQEFITLKHEKAKEMGGKFNFNRHVFDQLPDNRFVMIKLLLLRDGGKKLYIIPFDGMELNRRIIKKERRIDEN